MPGEKNLVQDWMEVPSGLPQLDADLLCCRHGNVVSASKTGKDFATIQEAIDYAVSKSPSASNLWTVAVYPGVYDEQVQMAEYVNLVGVGSKSSVVIYQADVIPIILADNSEVEHLTVRTGNTGDLACFADNAVACAAAIRDVRLESLYTGGGGWTAFLFTAPGSYTIERCSTRNTAAAGGTGDQGFVLVVAEDPSVKIIDCDVHMEGAPGITSSKSILGIIGPSAAVIESHGNRYSGDAFCNSFYAEDGTIKSNNDTLLTQYADQIDPAADVQVCRDIKITIDLAGAIPANADVVGWADGDRGVGIGTGGRIFFVMNVAGVAKSVEMT